MIGQPTVHSSIDLYPSSTLQKKVASQSSRSACQLVTAYTFKGDVGRLMFVLTPSIFQ